MIRETVKLKCATQSDGSAHILVNHNLFLSVKCQDRWSLLKENSMIIVKPWSKTLSFNKTRGPWADTKILWATI